MKLWFASLALVLLCATVSVSAAHADTTCWDDHEGEQLSVNGVISSLSQTDAGWSFMVEIKMADQCEIWEVFGEGALPAGCQKGDDFSAVGIIDASEDMMDYLDPEDGVVGLYANSVSCS